MVYAAAIGEFAISAAKKMKPDYKQFTILSYEMINY